MTVEIESARALSESSLWQLQEAAYNQFGINAWTNKGVPSYLTSHPLSAKYYASLVLAYLLDTPIDFSQPLYLFDLGAGTGRFAYLFLQEFLPKLKERYDDRLQIKYVMTDIIEENLQFLRDHPSLQLDCLEFALFQHDDATIHSLTQEDFSNPAILLCNYYFDTIPQDLYRVNHGKLEEGKISLSLDEETPFTDFFDPELIPHLHAHYSYGPLEKTYGNHYDEFLQQYASRFTDATILFPLGALQTIDTFRALTNNRLLVLSADQGLGLEDQVVDLVEPKIARHGSFSIQVSYHLLSHYFTYLGGRGFLSDTPDPTFINLAAVLPNNGANLSQTFDMTINHFSPSDYLLLSNAMEKDCPSPSLEHILTLIKLGGWDPINLHLFYNNIHKQLADATDPVKNVLYFALQKIRRNFYPTCDEEGAFLMNIGVLFYDLEAYYEALLCFEDALNYLPDDPQLYQNIANCQEQLS